MGQACREWVLHPVLLLSAPQEMAAELPELERLGEAFPLVVPPERRKALLLSVPLASARLLELRGSAPKAPSGWRREPQAQWKELQV